VYGRARVHGVLYGQASVHKRDTMKTAVQCLKVQSAQTSAAPAELGCATVMTQDELKDKCTKICGMHAFLLIKSVMA
jgi:hypothetical protein